MGTFLMPALGADMESGTVTEWRVKPGDQVTRGDIVAVVDTEKSTIEVEVFESGIIDEIVVPEGTQVPVGAVLALIATKGPTSAPRALQPSPTLSTPEHPPPSTEARGVPGRRTYSPLVRRLADELEVDLGAVAGSGAGGVVTRADVEHGGHGLSGQEGQRGQRRPSSPYARRLAAEVQIDLSSIDGSGPGGAVVARDVRTAATLASKDSPGSEPKDRRRTANERHEAMRRATGLLMARSKREIPHYYLSTDIDMSTAVHWLEQFNRERGVSDRLVPAVVLIKATARAVGKFPEVNGWFVDGEFRPAERANIGVAISLRGGGLVAPAICDADQLSLDELMVRLRDLVGRARAGTLRSSEVSDATITVTNLGDLGVESVFGVIYPPQVALVGFGRISDRPVVHGGLIEGRPTVTATLAADHRASDGHQGGRFLAEIDRLLQKPEEL